MVHGDGKEMKTSLDTLHGTRVNLMARVTLAILKTVYSCFPMTDLPKDFGMIVTVEEPEIRGHCANFFLNLNKQNHWINLSICMTHSIQLELIIYSHHEINTNRNHSHDKLGDNKKLDKKLM